MDKVQTSTTMIKLVKTWCFYVGTVGLLVGLLCFRPAFANTEIQVLALSKSKVVFLIDGKRKVLRIGEESAPGIKLIRTEAKSAIVEINGREEILQAGKVVIPYLSAASTSGNDSGRVTIWAGPDGFYRSDGKINGKSVIFLVDTGANTIALSGTLAKQIGLDLSKGQKSYAQTASGVAPMVALQLDTVSVGGITLHNIIAGVILGDYPQTPLLGASFLNRVDMDRDGKKMTLRRAGSPK